MGQQIEIPGQGIIEFPDGMSDNDIAAAIHSNFGSVQKPTYTTDPVRSTYQGIMENVAAPINNAVNSVTAPIMGAIASAEAPAAQGVANAIDSTSIGQWVGDKMLGAKQGVQGVVDEVNDLATYNPDLQRDLSAFGQNVQLTGNLPLAIKAGQVAIKAGQAIEPSLSKMPGMLGNTASGSQVVKPLAALQRPAIKSASQNAYDYSEAVNGVLSPEGFVNNVGDLVQAKKLSKIPGVSDDAIGDINATLDQITPAPGHAWTLKDYQNFDKMLTAKKYDAMNGYMPTNKSRILDEVQDEVRDRLRNIKEGDVIGGKEGFDALTNDAIPLWDVQSKLDDLETMIGKANASLNPDTAMKTAFKNLYYSKRINAYPDEVKKLIKKGSETGDVSDILGFMGSRLNPIVSNTATGKALSAVTSKVVRNMKNSAQNAKADRIMRALTEPVRGSVERFSSPMAVGKADLIAPNLSDEIVNNAARLGIDIRNKSEGMIREEISKNLSGGQYFNPNAKPLGKYLPNNALDNAMEEVEPINPYINPNAKVLGKYLPNNSIRNALEEAEPVKPEPQGTSSMYYSKGGSVKRKNLTAEFLARAKQ